MTDVVNLNFKDDEHISPQNNVGTNEKAEEEKSYNMESLIESESRKMVELNIRIALDEIRSEENYSIILQGECASKNYIFVSS